MKAISFDSGPPEVFSLLPKNGEVIHLGSVARPFRNHNISAVCGGDEHTILDFSKEQGIAMPQIGSKVMIVVVVVAGVSVQLSLSLSHTHTTESGSV